MDNYVRSDWAADDTGAASTTIDPKNEEDSSVPRNSPPAPHLWSNIQAISLNICEPYFRPVSNTDMAFSYWIRLFRGWY